MAESTLIAFLSGIGVTLSGVLMGSIVQRSSHKRLQKEQVRFDIYMRLLDINSLYFFVASAELRKEKVDSDLWRRLRDEAWRIADKLRQMDEVEYLDEILNVLLADSFDTAQERSAALDSLIEKLGRKVNPRYAEAIQRVSEINQRKMLSDLNHVSNAPGRT